MRKILFLLLATLIVSACNKPTQSTQTEQKAVNVPGFSSDSAFQFVQKQVDFGPRVPNSAAQTACANYLSTTLKRFGAEVIEQKADLQAYDCLLYTSDAADE